MNPMRRASSFVPPILPLLLLPWAAEANKVRVGEELQRLSAIHGFSVVGLETTEDATARAGGEELYPRLRRLLEGFDHVIVQTPGGGVDRVIVMGETVPFVPVPRSAGGAPGQGGSGSKPPAGDIVLDTERRGTQHSVNVSLEGAGGKRVSRSLLIDTGADFVVLPASLVASLGIAPAQLRRDEMQTANGKVRARVGVIPAVWLGDRRIPDVLAAFIDDGKLGNNGLLGMSVLGRYTMTIDDEAGRLTLASKSADRGRVKESGAEEAQADPETGAPEE